MLRASSFGILVVAGGLLGCAGDPEPLTLAEWLDQNAPTLLRQLGAYDDSERREAIRKLKEAGEVGRNAALALLQDPKLDNYRIEMLLARFLADEKDTRCIPFLLHFLEHPDPEAVDLAAEGLQLFPNELRVFEALTRYAESPDAQKRRTAAKILSKLRTRQAVELGAQSYKGESDREVRALYFISVSQSQHPQKKEFLVEMLPEEKDDALRRLIWGALKRCKDFPNVNYGALERPEERAPLIATLRRWARGQR